MLELKLQLFANGAGGDGGGDGGGSGMTVDGGVVTAPINQSGEEEAAAALEQLRQRLNGKRGKKSSNKNVEYVLPQAQPTGQQHPASAEQGDSGKTEASFDELIKGKYKDDFNKAVAPIVQGRIKNIKAAEETLAKLDPVLKALYKQNEVEEGNIDELVSRMTDDDSLYEEEALRKGIPVEVEREFQRMKQETNIMRQEAEHRDMLERFNAHLQGLAEQGEKLKETFPDFNLQTELQNDEFARLTSPEVNIPVETAYRVIHQDEIMQGLMQYSVQRGAQQVSKAIQSGAKRPAENGLNPTSNAVQLSNDPSTWPTEVIKKMLSDANSGKQIIL